MPNEHFVAPPNWEWYILLYFFFAGLAGGAFVIGTMLRLWGNAADWVTSRIAFLISLPLLLICPILLTRDLGKPLDFWHMLSRAMSRVGRLPTNVFGLVFMVIGAILGIFIAAYTGVLLAVSNQPVWSDTWTLGGLFLASGLSGAAATIMLLSRRQREATVTEPKLMEADRYFIILELILIAIFLITLGGLVTKVLGGAWILLWLVVLVGTLVPLLVEWRPRWSRQVSPVLASVLVLVGVLALRAVIIFSAQA